MARRTPTFGWGEIGESRLAAGCGPFRGSAFGSSGGLEPPAATFRGRAAGVVLPALRGCGTASRHRHLRVTRTGAVDDPSGPSAGARANPSGLAGARPRCGLRDAPEPTRPIPFTPRGGAWAVQCGAAFGLWRAGSGLDSSSELAGSRDALGARQGQVTLPSSPLLGGGTSSAELEPQDERMDYPSSATARQASGRVRSKAHGSIGRCAAETLRHRNGLSGGERP